MGRIMVMGTSSGAGKTTIAALLCRHFTLQGLKVAPFKANNLSLNSFVTSRGEEMGSLRPTRRGPAVVNRRR